MRALYLWREPSAVNAVLQAAAEYHLTDREKESLIGVTMGLTSKEVATRMDISPHTVKALLHVVMIKMGVPTRAGHCRQAAWSKFRGAKDPDARRIGKLSRRLTWPSGGTRWKTPLIRNNLAPP